MVVPTGRGGARIALSDVENLVRVADDVPLPAWQNVFLAAPKLPVYRFDPVASRFTAKTVEERLAFAAKIVITAQVDDKSVAESCSLRCQPVKDPVSRVVVEFSQSRPEPPQFQLHGEGQAALMARRLASDDSTGQEASGAGETWEVLLAKPQSSAFEIDIQRVTPFADRITLGLVHLPDAANQQAQVVVNAAADLGISIEAPGLTSLPVADDPGTPATRGVFQYTLADPTDQIVVARQPDSLAPERAGVVWHRRTESHYDVAGNSWHSATFRLRNSGREAVTITVPDKCDITRLWLDGHRCQKSVSGQQVRVDLPSDESAVTLAVEYRELLATRLSNIPLSAPAATIDLPVISSDWLLWLPPGFVLDGVVGGNSEPSAASFSWSERLFGPLGRSQTNPPLALFSSGGWSRLAVRVLGDDMAISYASRFHELARTQTQSLDAASWGTLLAAANEFSQDSGVALRVDAAALAARGIGPGSQIPPPAVHFADQPDRGLLANSNLALLYSPDVVLLTSRAAALIHRDELRWLEPDQIGAFEPEAPFLATILARSSRDEDYPTAATWTTQGRQPDASADEARSFAGDLGTATPYLIHADGESVPVAHIIYPAGRNAARAVACVLALAMCLHFVRRMDISIAWLAIAAGAALVFPERFAPLATGGFWGIALAIAWQWIAPIVWPARREANSAASKSTSRRLVTALPLLLAIMSLAGLGLLASRAAGQQEAKPMAREEGPDDTYRVFIPVDDEEQPTRGKYQVPERLYDELQRLVTRGSGTTGGWLIRAARYQLSLAATC